MYGVKEKEKLEEVWSDEFSDYKCKVEIDGYNFCWCYEDKEYCYFLL